MISTVVFNFCFICQSIERTNFNVWRVAVFLATIDFFTIMKTSMLFLINAIHVLHSSCPSWELWSRKQVSYKPLEIIMLPSADTFMYFRHTSSCLFIWMEEFSLHIWRKQYPGVFEVCPKLRIKQPNKNIYTLHVCNIFPMCEYSFVRLFDWYRPVWTCWVATAGWAPPWRLWSSPKWSRRRCGGRTRTSNNCRTSPPK